VKELPLTGGRDAIASDALTDEQKEVVDTLCREEADLRAAFNQVLRDKGLNLELVHFQLANARPAAASSVGDPPPIIVPDIPSHPPPGGCYCCVGGACYCC
jgi:hypothetical protein